MPTGSISEATNTLDDARRKRRTVFLVGNGGSAATASHFANDLSKATRREGAPHMRVVALTDNVPLITAWANDVRYEDVFARQLDGLIAPDDVLVVFSGSGNSPNVIEAVHVARAAGARVVGLTGRDGGALAPLSDVAIVVPLWDMTKIEDAHLIIAHLIACLLADGAEFIDENPALSWMAKGAAAPVAR